MYRIDQEDPIALTNPSVDIHIHSNTTMVKALLHYTNLPFIRQPATATTSTLAPTPSHNNLDKYGLPPDEPYLGFSLPLPAWGQDNVVRRTLEHPDDLYKLTALAHAVCHGHETMAEELLAVRTLHFVASESVGVTVRPLHAQSHTQTPYTQAGADPTFLALLPDSFSLDRPKLNLVELARYMGHHALRWKLEVRREGRTCQCQLHTLAR